MKTEIHKYIDKYVIFRFDDKRETLTRDKRSEYRTWTEWKSWYRYAKLFPIYKDAFKEFLLLGYKFPNEERDTESSEYWRSNLQAE